MHRSTPYAKRVLLPGLVATSDDLAVSTDVWLPHIGRWLPGTWSEAVIASKAVKSDNAPIDYKPWRRRIQLVFPCSDGALSVLERLATRRWRRKVCRSFFDYIRHIYGDSWRDLAFPSTKRPAVSDSRPNISKRRKRFSYDNESARSLRGVDGEVVAGIDGDIGGTFAGTDGDVGGTVSSTDGDVGDTGASINEPDIPSLLADLSSGLLVIGQILLSTWWEWTHGSSPLSWRWNGPDQIKAARDGLHIFCQSPLANSRRSVSLPRFDADTRKIVASKISSITSHIWRAVR